MNKKTLISVIIIIILIVLGIWYYRTSTGPVPTTGTAQEGDGIPPEAVLERIIAEIDEDEPVDVQKNFQAARDALDAL